MCRWKSIVVLANVQGVKYVAETCGMSAFSEIIPLEHETCIWPNHFLDLLNHFAIRYTFAMLFHQVFTSARIRRRKLFGLLETIPCKRPGADGAISKNRRAMNKSCRLLGLQRKSCKLGTLSGRSNDFPPLFALIRSGQVLQIMLFMSEVDPMLYNIFHLVPWMSSFYATNLASWPQ